MKKKLHLRKTKPHWKRKPAPVVTWRDKLAARQKAEAAERARRAGFGIDGIAAGVAAAALMLVAGRR